MPKALVTVETVHLVGRYMPDLCTSIGSKWYHHPTPAGMVTHIPSLLLGKYRTVEDLSSLDNSQREKGCVV